MPSTPPGKGSLVRSPGPLALRCGGPRTYISSTLGIRTCLKNSQRHTEGIPFSRRLRKNKMRYYAYWFRCLPWGAASVPTSLDETRKNIYSYRRSTRRSTCLPYVSTSVRPQTPQCFFFFFIVEFTRTTAAVTSGACYLCVYFLGHFLCLVVFVGTRGPAACQSHNGTAVPQETPL